ncbi:MAG TPA: 4-hydroxy-tetrahydrodipicolinate reductase [Candidatus Mcinerneyibacteriales bacterium]|nr:4-hydroxy-tetrahydrodipicolinate reductase [Candidatus Mcinerneyibacteriales bacterium]HPE20450.1 4-hydroxy-tetrahydrodipicolinate reductase [Candidatus Mcinerneyibacteriales bacterium]HPQ88551.1 4-hydroxy-tetrahydrodipicolinate reductase [Candidatus Mcinerneyibacteriales bacterium]
MNIGLIGYGKMGKMIHRLAEKEGHKVTFIQDPQEKDLARQDRNVTDVYIDFSTGDAVRENILMACREKKPLVIGSTGWEWDKALIDAVEKSGICLVSDSNFSPGMYLFRCIVEEAASLISLFDTYDVAGVEMHHKEKADVPSGTARVLSEIIIKNFLGKKNAEFYPKNEKRSDDSFHFASLRCGRIPGIHTLLFDSEEDTIELTHQTRTREGFARGALLAAEWTRQENGIRSFKDVMESLMRKEIE